MSGIVGVFNLNGEPVRREILISMCDAINHRGPHDRGVWTEGPVGFGHVLLHTTEESLREQQPFSFDDRTWITAEARIDDRASLIDLLKSHVHSGEDLREATDVALLLHAYHAWGVDCVNHIIGVFAAVIWDGREHQLVCLRDQIGIKPFYYANTPDRLVFASEVKAILASGLIPQRIYEPRIADYLVSQLEGIDKTCTFFEGIVRLPPAHRMVFKQSGKTIEEYWSLDPTREMRFENHKDYSEAFREVFSKAVKCRLRGTVPVASMLSGGLDSSCIVAMARKILAVEAKPTINTFSIVNSKDPSCVETSQINHVLVQGGLDPTKIDIENLEKYWGELDGGIDNCDDLFDYNMEVPQIIYLETHRRGISAVLDGVDGDLVMGQPGNHIAYLMQNRQFKAAVREARYTRRFYSSYSGNTFSYLYGAFRNAFMPSSLRYLRRRWRGFWPERLLKHETKDTSINQYFARNIGLLERVTTLQNHQAIPDRINLRQNHRNALNHPYLVVALERYDRVASRYSIEPRHPLLDRRLIEFCLALPWDQKVTDGWTKMIARRSMTGLLPEKVIWRKGKDDLITKVIANRLSYDLDKIRDTFTDSLATISNYVDADFISRDYHSCNLVGEGSNVSEGYKFLQIQALSDWIARWGNDKYG